jgi:predicted dehydrogenase
MQERKLRAAVVGAGWYAAQNHIPALARRPEVLLDGVCRLGEQDLERVREHFGFAYASEDAGSVLARDPDIVIVASPHHLHYEHAAMALSRGAHVLCEKPMTLDPSQAWQLVAEAELRKRHLLIANGYNYLPQVDGLRQRIADGAIGRIEHAVCTFISATRDVFVGERGLESWRTAFVRPDRRTWQDPAQGGGFAHGQLSHSLALLFFLTELTPIAVAAQTCPASGIDLANAAVLRLSNGAVASISGAAAMPQGHRALMRVFLAGSEGVLTAEFDRDWCEIRRNDRTVDCLDLSDGEWTYRCDGPVDALVDLALGRGANLSSAALGAYTTATIAAMLDSAREGGSVLAVLRG